VQDMEGKMKLENRNWREDSRRKSGSRGVVNAGILLLAAAPAWGYTDPGSGLLVWQMLGAAVVGGLFYVRRLMEKITGKAKVKDRTECDPANRGGPLAS
jgi:hypothetical protein